MSPWNFVSHVVLKVTTLLVQEFMAALHEASVQPLCDLVLIDDSCEAYGLPDASKEQQAAIQYVAYAASLAQWQQ